MKRSGSTVLLHLAACAALPLNASVITGTIANWGDSTHMNIGGSGITGYWSVASPNNSGYFYGSSFGAGNVAAAPGVVHISGIPDASVFTFSASSVGPLSDDFADGAGPGDFLVYRDTGSGQYAVLRIDDIHGIGGNPFDQQVDVTYWFQTDCPTPGAASCADFTDAGDGAGDPVMPAPGTGPFVFNNPQPRRWFDPMMVEIFEFDITGGGFFSQAGLDANWAATLLGGGVRVWDGATFGAILPFYVNPDPLAGVAGDGIPDFLFDFTSGVNRFRIVGIDPSVDADDPLAFPVYLDYTGSATSITMTGIASPSAVPEPGTYALLGVGIGLIALRRRTKAQRE